MLIYTKAASTSIAVTSTQNVNKLVEDLKNSTNYLPMQNWRLKNGSKNLPIFMLKGTKNIIAFLSFWRGEKKFDMMQIDKIWQNKVLDVSSEEPIVFESFEAWSILNNSTCKYAFSLDYSYIHKYLSTLAFLTNM